MEVSSFFYFTPKVLTVALRLSIFFSEAACASFSWDKAVPNSVNWLNVPLNRSIKLFVKEDNYPMLTFFDFTLSYINHPFTSALVHPLPKIQQLLFLALLTLKVTHQSYLLHTWLQLSTVW